MRAIERFNQLESDSVLQNHIAQTDARYILLNTKEEPRNFPNYTFQDENLLVLAFYYLDLGCRIFEDQQSKENGSDYELALTSVEKGATIIEHLYAASKDKSPISHYLLLISAISYYLCFQYSKAFILIQKIENSTPISNLITLFLRKDHANLLHEATSLLVSKETLVDVDENEIDEKIAGIVYSTTIAKVLYQFVMYLRTGDKSILQIAQEKLIHLKEVADIESNPDMWWVSRLLFLISKWLDDASLWSGLWEHFKISDEVVKNYIHCLTYWDKTICELFITQRRSLPKVLDTNGTGCVVTIPTSSWKTRIAEIAILKCKISDWESKILYIAPFRSLAYEIEGAFDKTLAPVGIRVSHLYGWSLFSKIDEELANESDVIIATPEKAKALLRSNVQILNQIKLIVLDEWHLLWGGQRYTSNEMFYEELRYFSTENKGKFLVLSAVLPNPEQLSLWLTNSKENVFKGKWRPADERLGILEWNWRAVNLNWQSSDTERDSFNRNFIVVKDLPLKPRERTVKTFPSDKNEAVALTAHKFNQFGSVLIFVWLKDSVFVMAKSYLRCLDDQDTDFTWKNQYEWRAFVLACEEAYWEENDWVMYAKKWILCHSADLHKDARLPLERLMRDEKPRVIICTSTLWQGVNLGVSTVIFSTIYQAGTPITTRDFWNIAGRAGRAFIDYEWKILVAMDATPAVKPTKKEREKEMILNYFDKDQIDSSQSGVLMLVRKIKESAESCGISFEQLLEKIADDNLFDFQDGTDIQKCVQNLDWIDDVLLTLHNAHNPDETVNDYGWVDNFFRASLANIQDSIGARNEGNEDVLKFMKARTIGIVKKVWSEKNKWISASRSGIPLSSHLALESKLPALIGLIENYQQSERTGEDLIALLKWIESEINDIPILKEDYWINEVEWDSIRRGWLSWEALFSISTPEKRGDIINKHYTFKLPWVLNGIARQLQMLSEEINFWIIEELSVLVELGLPNMVSAKIYQAGIHSRTASKELSEVFWEELSDVGVKYVRAFLSQTEISVESVSAKTLEWISFLVHYSSEKWGKLRTIPNFSAGDLHKKTKCLTAAHVNGKQYLLSPDLVLIQEVPANIVDFSSANKSQGIFFTYNDDSGEWEMKNNNPYLRFEDSSFW